ncbi:MAG: hypothetical protein PUH93_04380 [Clostridia bacterium]|nr:hypothetical protein [Clostridia bacterium]
MRRLKKRTGNRLAKVRYYDKNAQNASSEEEAEVITEESEEVVETEEVAEETEPADEAETAEAAETTEEVAEEEPEVVEEVEVAGTDEPEAIEEVGKITEPEETTEEEEETNAIEEVAEAVEPEEETETVTEVEDVEEVPLEYAEEESDVILEEEGSLDGSLDEVAALAEKAEEEEAEEEEALKPEEIEPEAIEEVEVAGTDEPEVIEEVGKITEPAPTTEEEEEANAIEEVAEAVEPETENTATTEEVEAVEEVAEVPTEAEKAEELAVTATEELAEEETEKVEESEEAEETAEEEEEAAEEAEEAAAEAAEEKPAEKETFKLTAPSNLEEILSGICVKRGRKLIYRPNEILFNETATVLGTDKNNEEGIKVKNILDEEIKQGVKLGYIDKYDGLKMSEIKEEYENDTIYEYAEQEFKRTGLLLDGDKVKVYIYDWDMKALHHVGYIEGEEAEAVKPYLIDREKYSFDICGLITGGKYRKIIKDESGKVTVEKGNDGKLGVELDISVIARKD